MLSARTLRWGWLCQCVCCGAWADCVITGTRVMCMGAISHYRSCSACQLGLRFCDAHLVGFVAPLGRGAFALLNPGQTDRALEAPASIQERMVLCLKYLRRARLSVWTSPSPSACAEQQPPRAKRCRPQCWDNDGSPPALSSAMKVSCSSYHWNVDPMCDCQIGPKYPIVGVKQDQPYPIHFSSGLLTGASRRTYPCG
jgi:hypothetical protein